MSDIVCCLITDSLTAGRQLSLALSELGSSCFLSCVHQVPSVCPALPGPGEDVESRVCFSHVCTLHTHTHATPVQRDTESLGTPEWVPDSLTSTPSASVPQEVPRASHLQRLLYD